MHTFVLTTDLDVGCGLNEFRSAPGDAAVPEVLQLVLHLVELGLFISAMEITIRKWAHLDDNDVAERLFFLRVILFLRESSFEDPVFLRSTGRN